MKRRRTQWTLAALLALTLQVPLGADDAKKPKQVETVYPVAVFPFAERGREVEGFGSKTTDLLFANLVADPELYLVDREDLSKLIEEQELNTSGLVRPSEAVQIGQLTGAKILVTGSVLQVGEKLYVVAKLIGTETSRVLGASVKGNIEDDLDELVEQLAQSVRDTVVKRADDLVAEPVERDDYLAALKKRIGKKNRLSVIIDISERHIGQTAGDPAAETELTLICKELGFEVLDSAAKKKDADILLTGEAFSEFASRHGNLVSVKGRLELKALDPETGRVIAVDRQTSVAVDLAEQIAAKSSLAEATARLAERLLPKIAGKR